MKKKQNMKWMIFCHLRFEKKNRAKTNKLSNWVFFLQFEMQGNPSDEFNVREVLLRFTDRCKNICVFLPSSVFAHSLLPLKKNLMLKKR